MDVVVAPTQAVYFGRCEAGRRRKRFHLRLDPFEAIAGVSAIAERKSRFKQPFVEGEH
jgi:hypothetical protein